jgi:hypothetical protein
MKRHLALLAAAPAAAGCAGISQPECELSDWRAVGLHEDGSPGDRHDFGTYRAARLTG